MKKKILITGATGFVGSRLIDWLADQYDIIGIGRNEEKGRQLESKGIRFLKVDIADKQDISGKLQDISVDFVVHLAAKSSLWGKYDDFYQSNVVATRNILEYSISKQIERLVYISTPSVYDTRTKSINLNEDDPVYTSHFPNHYIHTKMLAEQLVLQDETLNPIVLRPRGIFGPGDTSILPRFIESNRRFGIPFVNGGQNLVDITYVDNVCEAIRLALKVKDIASKRIYNVCNGSPIALSRLLELLESLLGEKIRRKQVPLFVLRSLAAFLGAVSSKEPVITSYSLELLTKSITMDTNRIREELGYRSVVSLEDGLKIAINAYLNKR